MAARGKYVITVYMELPDTCWSEGRAESCAKDSLITSCCYSCLSLHTYAEYVLLALALACCREKHGSLRPEGCSPQYSRSTCRLCFFRLLFP